MKINNDSENGDWERIVRELHFARVDGSPRERIYLIAETMARVMVARVLETGADECNGTAVIGGLQVELRIKLDRAPGAGGKPGGAQ
jgi:hypothetical protein